MSLSAKLLLDGEHVVEETRTHVKVLVLPFLLGLAVMAVAGFTYGAIGDSADTWVRVAVVGVALVLDDLALLEELRLEGAELVVT